MNINSKFFHSLTEQVTVIFFALTPEVLSVPFTLKPLSFSTLFEQL